MKLRVSKDAWWSNELQAWMVSGYDPLVRVITSADLAPASSNHCNGPRNLQQLDGVEHTRLRALVAGAFSHGAVGAVRSRVLRMIDDSLNLALAAGRFDVMQDLARPLSIGVMCLVLGLPVSDGAQLADWTHLVAAGMGPTHEASARDRAAAALDSVDEYLSNVLICGRERNGLIGALARTRQLDDAELVTMVRLLLFAGSYPSALAIGNTILTLVRHPEQLQLLRRDRRLLSSAIDESLRFETVIQIGAPRTAVRTTSVGSRQVRKGDTVLPMYGSANRDPSRFRHPYTFDITRTPNRHLGFGRGRHACLAPGLARLMLELTIGRLVERFRRLRLASQPEPLPTPVTRGLWTLPISLDAGSAHVGEQMPFAS